MRRSRMQLALGSVALLLVAALAAMAWRVDDWRRDFTHNEAATDEHAADPALRPIRSNLAVGELANIAERVAGGLPRWRLETRSMQASKARLAFVRATSVWRFEDDVVLRIEPASDGSVLNAESKSRVGRGDLGQNPRNLKELLGAIRSRLEEGARE